MFPSTVLFRAWRLTGLSSRSPAAVGFGLCRQQTPYVSNLRRLQFRPPPCGTSLVLRQDYSTRFRIRSRFRGIWQRTRASVRRRLKSRSVRKSVKRAAGKLIFRTKRRKSITRLQLSIYRAFFQRHSRLFPMASTGPSPSILSRLPKKQQVLGYLRAKRDEYISAIGSGNDIEDDYNISPDLAQLNGPFHDEQLLLYPCYAFQRPDGQYEVIVRGWLHLPEVPNRKSRIVYSLAKQIAGINSSNVSVSSNPQQQQQQPIKRVGSMESITSITPADEQDEEVRRLEKVAQDDKDSTPSGPMHTDTMKSLRDDEKVLRQRLSHFLARAAPFRKIYIRVGSDEPLDRHPKVEQVVTAASGRFFSRIVVPYKPSAVTAEASDNDSVYELGNVLTIGSEGVSVISDIDDTIKNTGMTGVKRELFRNVFIRTATELEIEGVADWYKDMAEHGAQFHYVSNSPWQLYSTIAEYIEQLGLPKGSIHLKQYSGVLNGILEPAAEKKREALYSIVRDFPNHKFILVGDSGEADLEAYVDLAKAYPKQILSIYIRDVTNSDNSNDFTTNEDLLATSYIPTPEEIDDYDRAKSTRSLPRRPQRPSRNASSRSTTTPPSTSSAHSTSSASSPSAMPDLIDLSEPEPAQPAQPAEPAKKPKAPPKVPRKPVALRGAPIPRKSDDSNTGSQPDSHPSSQPSSQPSARASQANSPSVTPPPPPPSRRSRTVPSAPVTVNEPQSQTQSQQNPPPLPPRRHTTRTTATDTDTSSVFSMSSSQNDYGELNIPEWDKRVESWKMRINRARQTLPSSVRLRMWRRGTDVYHESITIVKEHTNSRK